eukprot:jgi/Chlat1/6296/Chrsp44S05878
MSAYVAARGFGHVGTPGGGGQQTPGGGGGGGGTFKPLLFPPADEAEPAGVGASSTPRGTPLTGFRSPRSTGPVLWGGSTPNHSAANVTPSPWGGHALNHTPGSLSSQRSLGSGNPKGYLYTEPAAGTPLGSSGGWGRAGFADVPAPPPPMASLDDKAAIDTPELTSNLPSVSGQQPASQSYLSLVIGARQRGHSSMLTPSTPAVEPYHASDAYDDCWVTVFGFSEEDTGLVLREFQKCGDIVNYGTFAPGRANWIHIQYQNKYQARKALSRNGIQLSSTLIVGVKVPSPWQRSAFQDRCAPVDALHALPQKSTPVPVAAVQRPYLVDGASKQTGATLPQVNRSLWGKITEHILGL